MNKDQRYLKNRAKSNRMFLLFIIFILALAFISFKKINSDIKEEISLLNQKIEDKNSDIENIKVDIKDLKSDYDMRNSDEFKEKIARERLGMVKKDEYVYKDENNN